MGELILIAEHVPDHAPLKQCPFCGLTPEYVRLTQGDKWGNVACCCEGPETRTSYNNPAAWIPDAITEWNHRAEPQGESDE